jgi:transcriptional regulator NrdR family protein
MTIYKIRKRNGSIVTFEKDKITAAIQAAFEAVQNSDTDKIPALVDIIISNVESKI